MALGKIGLFLISIILVSIIGAGTVWVALSEQNHSSSFSSTSSSTLCTTTFPGQALGALIRILNDSTLQPISGATVMATAPIAGMCNTTTQPYGIIQFVTNNTEWYSLSTFNRGTYQITVTDLGHSYSLTLPLGLSIWNCETIYLPSGRTNATTSTGQSCQTLSSTSSTSVSSSTQSATSSSSISQSSAYQTSTTTEPCTAPGVICGGVQILNDSLFINDNGDSTFSITLKNTGSIAYQEVRISLSNVLVLDRTGSWGVDNVTQFTINIPSSEVALYAGSTYKLEVDTFYLTDNVSYPVQQLASLTANIMAMPEPTMTMMTG